MQIAGLRLDRGFDSAQAASGYPGLSCPAGNDEGFDVNIFPSLIAGSPTGSGWVQRKATYGPKASDLARLLHLPAQTGPGRHPDGQEDYAP